MTKAGYRLVIVESPAKAKTIQRYLGPGYEVDASVGHIRDLPGKGTKAPEKYKDKSWYRLAVDVDGDFTPIYVVPADKRAKVAELKKKLEAASELLLATDEDREGEAICLACQLLCGLVKGQRAFAHRADENFKQFRVHLVSAFRRCIGPGRVPAPR